jgi:hypothetical protein
VNPTRREIPSLVSGMIEKEQCTGIESIDSFTVMLNIVKRNGYKIVEGLDIQEVSKFMNFIELPGTLTEYEKLQSQSN